MKRKKEQDPHHIEVEYDGLRYPFRVWREKLFDKSNTPTRIIDVWCAHGDSEMRDDFQMHIDIPRMFGATTLERCKELILCGFKNQRTDWERKRKGPV